jgi:hypothetical protein
MNLDFVLYILTSYLFIVTKTSSDTGLFFRDFFLLESRYIDDLVINLFSLSLSLAFFQFPEVEQQGTIHFSQEMCPYAAKT